MKKIENILIVEDEALIADQLAALVETASYQVVDIVDEAEDVFSTLEKEAVDLVFLDINLSGFLDGVDIANKIKSDFHIPFIFISSNTDQRTLKRMSLTQPISFITKPFQKESVLAALEIAQQKQVENKSELTEDPTIFVKNGHVWEKMRVGEIRYIEAQDNYIAIHLETERKMILMTMKSIQEQLPLENFVRVHRSFIVNKDCIDTIGPNFILVGEKEIPLSASGKQEVMEKVKRLG